MHYNTVKPKHQGCTGDCNYRPIRNSRRHIADAAAVNGKSSATCRARRKNVRQSWTNAEDLFRVSCLYSMQSCCVYSCSHLTYLLIMELQNTCCVLRRITVD